MAFIYLRRSRNTRSYLLIESYRDDRGRARKRTLCYLGRECDGTDTLEKALAHWQRARDSLKAQISTARGDRRAVLRRRLVAAEARIVFICEQITIQQRRVVAAEEATHWQAIERLRREPIEENAKAAKRAFLWLAKRHHPDQGGSHEGFLRVKDAYELAQATWKR